MGRKRGSLLTAPCGSQSQGHKQPALPGCRNKRSSCEEQPRKARAGGGQGRGLYTHPEQSAACRAGLGLTGRDRACDTSLPLGSLLSVEAHACKNLSDMLLKVKEFPNIALKSDHSPTAF